MLRKRRARGGVGSNITVELAHKVAESHTAVLKKQFHRNNKLSGQTPHGAHIAGFHRNVGLENVLQCFTKYIHHVRDHIPPASACVDQTWLNTVD